MLFADAPAVLKQSFRLERFCYVVYFIHVWLGAIKAILAWHLQPIAHSMVYLITSNLYHSLVEFSLLKVKEGECQNCAAHDQ